MTPWGQYSLATDHGIGPIIRESNGSMAVAGEGPM
jgi:hypothetical protein